MSRIRVKCINDRWNPNTSEKDPELTKGKFYDVVNPNVPVYTGESRLSVVGDSGDEVERPKYCFRALPERPRKVALVVTGTLVKGKLQRRNVRLLRE